jgi:hypothetical protein
MLVYYFTHVDRPFEEAEEALLSLPHRLSRVARVAYREGEQLQIRMRPARLPAADVVHLQVGAPVRRPSRTTVPLSWEARGGTRLFHRMEADLILEPLDATSCHLSFSGSYDPPLGLPTVAADRMPLHRVAEATVKRFMDAMAAAIVRDPLPLAGAHRAG